jgi:hypothetical protein
MGFDRFSRVMLVIIVLILILIALRASHGQGAEGVPQSGQDRLNYVTQSGVANIACSTDGKVVYVVGNQGIVRSLDYGKKGTWELVLKDD